MAIERVTENAKNAGLYIEALDYSPITGSKGNIEYISLFSLKNQVKELDIDGVINSSLQLKNGGK